jgi:DNA-binding XRE family transcriptional regulator
MLYNTKHVLGEKMSRNHLKKIRESFLLGKSELARKANLSVETLSRIEHGKPCRIGTKRKILLGLGLNISDLNKVFI